MNVILRGELMQYGIMRLIEILGEAARHLSDDFKATHPEIPWRQIIGMRNRMAAVFPRIHVARRGEGVVRTGG